MVFRKAEFKKVDFFWLLPKIITKHLQKLKTEFKEQFDAPFSEKKVLSEKGNSKV